NLTMNGRLRLVFVVHHARLTGTSGPERHRYYTARIAGLRVHGNDRGLREEIEVGGTRPRVRAHGAPDDEVAGREPRQHQILRDHIDAIARRAGEHRGQALTAIAQRLDRIARVIVELTAVGAVQPIVEVIP